MPASLSEWRVLHKLNFYLKYILAYKPTQCIGYIYIYIKKLFLYYITHLIYDMLVLDILFNACQKIELF